MSMVKAQKAKLQQIVVDDLKQFFIDKKIRTTKILPNHEDDVRFYQVHFDNFTTNAEFEILEKDLREYGYEPKRHRGNLPESFYLIVMLVKKL